MIRHFIKQYLVLIVSLLALAVLMDWIYQQQESRKGAIYLNQINEYINTESGFLQIPITTLSLKDLELSPAQLAELQAGSPIILNDNAKNKTEHYILAKDDSSSEFVLLGPIKEINHSNFGIIFYLGVTAILIFWLTYFFNSLLKLKKSANEFSETLDESVFERHWRTGLDPVFNALKRMAIRNKTLIEVQKDINSTLSHEIRTPLMKLGFKTKLLSADNIEEQRLAIKQDLDRINNLVTEMLNYAKSDANLPHLDIQKIDVSSLLQEIISELKITHSKRITLKLCTGYLLADKTTLVRALENLITNSIKYSNSNILITTTQTEASYKILVEDDGPGIANQSDSIKPFNRCHLEDDEGFGLGMSIANKAIEWNGGVLMLGRSEQLGGAQISIQFNLDHFVDQN